MATYHELYQIWSTKNMKEQITIAIFKKAVSISTTVKQKPDKHGLSEDVVGWAKQAFANPGAMALKMSGAVIFDPGLDLDNPTDDQVQAAVDSLVDTVAFSFLG